jgi:hypothetical protein
VVADFNQDRRPDVFIACHDYEIAGGESARSFYLLSTPNDRYEIKWLPFTSYTHGAAAGDVDHDGYPDILLLNASRSATDVAYATLLMNNRDGTFRRDDSRLLLPDNVMCAPAFPCQMYSAELIDVDDDGNLDAVIAGGDNPDPARDFPVTIFYGNRLGSFIGRPPTTLAKDADCLTPLQIFRIGAYLYTLRECEGYRGSALVRTSIASWKSERIWKMTSPYPVGSGTLFWLDWLFLRDGWLIHDWVYGLRIEP